MNVKIIVSNRGALKNLYKDKFALVTAALDTLIGSDQRRCIKTEIIYLDDKAVMEAMKVTPVTDPQNEKQNKDAIDGVYNAMKPDYLTILGTPDIVPQQTMDNPVAAAFEDPNVPSDLPYACDAAYSRNIADFTNPGRVVGRLSGIKGNGDPAVLVRAINTAAALEKRKREEYNKYFSVSAKVWEGSTTGSLRNIFGNADDLQLSPPSGPDWTDAQLMTKSHFVNCHGGSNDPRWYGQDGGNYPVAVAADQIRGKIVPGTIATAECCYGAQLYPGWSVCISYINSDCNAFCGSTTIAYGPAAGQGQADLITQYFLISLLAGSSAGSAMLSARQRYIRECQPLSPVDLKTIGQFYLLGDSSSAPVGEPPAVEPKTEGIFSAEDRLMAGRLEKRMRFRAEADALKESVGIAFPDKEAVMSDEVRSVMEKAVASLELKDTVKQSFTVSGGRLFTASRKGMPGTEKIHTVSGMIDKSPDGIYNARIIIIKEMNGSVVSMETLHAK